MKRTNKKAFTIVELVIVIAVIAVLAAVLIPTFSSIIKKANESKDTQLVRNLNTALVTDKASNGNVAHATMYSALEAAKVAGYDVSKINASATDNEILWDSVNDVFCYFNGTAIEYIPEAPAAKTAEDIDYFVISDTIDAKYSTYYTGTKTVIDTDKGFDAGECTGIATVNYVNKSTTQTVVIRTNSEATTLNIDAPAGTVKHYDTVGVVYITGVANASYHEFGTANYVQNASGRVVAENGGLIKVCVLTDKGTATYAAVAQEDGGKIEKCYATTNEVATANNSENTNNVQLVVEAVANNGNVLADTEENAKVVADALKDDAASEAVSVAVANEKDEKGEAKNYVARIGSTGYETLVAALNAATEGQTVIMLKDSAENGLKAKVANVTLNMNGYSLTNASGNTINQYGSGSLIVKGSANSVISGDVRVYASVTFDDDFNGKVTGNIVRDGGTLYINGGIFEGTFTKTSTTVTIAGGCFKTQPTTSTKLLLAYGKTFEYHAADEYYHVATLSETNAVISATVGGVTKYYLTLKDAQEYAVNGGTIKLLQDFTYVNSNIVSNYYPTANVTLDLNGHTLNMGSYTNGIMIYSGTLTVIDSVGAGKIISNNNCKPFKVYGAANLTITSVNLSDKITLVDFNTDATGTVTLNNVVTNKGISTRGTVIYNNCTINSQITVSSGTATVNGGKYEMIVINNGASATINTGTFGYINNSGSLNIVTCIIDADIIGNETALYCVENELTDYTCTDNGDGTWTVTKK